MDTGFLLKGLIIGFSIAAPVGPIGVLCIRRTAAGGFVRGVTLGLGTATADAVYGTIAAFGLTTITTFLVGHQSPLRLVGGIFLFWLGARTFLSKPKEVGDPEGSIGTSMGLGRSAGGYGPIELREAVGGFLSTFFLTVTNPITILAFTAVFAGAGLGMKPGDYSSAGLMVAGVFLGSALWWCVLCGGVRLFSRAITPRVMRVINYIAGIVIAGFGVYLIYRIL